MDEPDDQFYMGVQDEQFEINQNNDDEIGKDILDANVN